jgi:Mce-associated membrane protein
MAVEPDDADITEQVSESTEADVEDRDDHVDDLDEADEVDRVDETDEAAEIEEVDEIDEEEDQSADRPARPWRRRVRRPLSRVGWALVAGAVVVATLAGLTGWLGYRAHDKHEAKVRRDLLVQTARQGAVNLTTISYTEIDADVQRILDSATGAFRDDFEKRSRPFIEVVKAAQSKSEGTITEAGLESLQGDSAWVLVAVAVKSRTAAGEQAPREWRMRIDVQAVGDGAKVSNVVFVP